MTTVQDIEREIEKAVDATLGGRFRELGVLPAGYRCAVRLQGENRDKRWSADFARNWRPDSDSIRIEFYPSDADTLPTPEAKAVNSLSSAPSDRLSDLIRALDRAESRPGYDFVSLKFFRDMALLGEGFAWTSDADMRHAVIRDAIDRRLVLTHKVPNPKSPQFPVTAIRLNRAMPEVQAALGQSESQPAAFRPVQIRGEPLSTTVLRDRR